ncbi:GTPase [Leeuwenhoekiella sp. H156]|uniref:GTPase n=1 Tax=Leeuwenhoekiella sp. H156 TaxID=3450128 RepID=UPI003FA4BC2B
MKLLLVYNARSGGVQAALDSLHKIVSPATYACDLCKLTHGNLNMHRRWKEFLNQSDFEISVYHKDEFQNEFGNEALAFKLPVILEQKDDGLTEFISQSEIQTLKDDVALIELIKAKSKIP